MGDVFDHAMNDVAILVLCLRHGSSGAAAVAGRQRFAVGFPEVPREPGNPGTTSDSPAEGPCGNTTGPSQNPSPNHRCAMDGAPRPSNPGTTSGSLAEGSYGNTTGPSQNPSPNHRCAIDGAPLRVTPVKRHAMNVEDLPVGSRDDCPSSPPGRGGNIKKMPYDPRVPRGPVGPCSTRGYKLRPLPGPSRCRTCAHVPETRRPTR